MKKVQIKRNTKGEINIDGDAQTNGISIALVDEKHFPIARYEFDSKKVSNLNRLLYDANGVRIHFYGNIFPTMIFETISKIN